MSMDRDLCRERLIRLVKKNRILWDKTTMDFTNRSAKHQKWMDVSKALGISIDKVRRIWENLRDQYRRDLKRLVKHNAKSKWRFYNDMNFIRPMVRIQETIESSESESDDGLTDERSNEITIQATHLNTACSPASITFVHNFHPIQLSTELQEALYTSEQRHESLHQGNEENINYNKLTTHGEAKQQQEQPIPSSKGDFSNQSVTDNEPVGTTENIDLVKVEIETNHQQSKEEQEQQSSIVSEPLISTSAMVASSPLVRQEAAPENERIIPYENSVLTELNHGLNAIQDEDYHFVMSILPSLRQVARQRKLSLRVGIMKLIENELDSHKKT